MRSRRRHGTAGVVVFVSRRLRSRWRLQLQWAVSGQLHALARVRVERVVLADRVSAHRHADVHAMVVEVISLDGFQLETSIHVVLDGQMHAALPISSKSITVNTRTDTSLTTRNACSDPTEWHAHQIVRLGRDLGVIYNSGNVHL